MNWSSRSTFGVFALHFGLTIAAQACAEIVTDWNLTVAARLQAPGTAVPPGARRPKAVSR